MTAAGAPAQIRWYFDLPDKPSFANLLHELGIDRAALDAPSVKQALRGNSTQAIEDALFGVPTAVATTAHVTRLIWGLDALPMLAHWLAAAPMFSSSEMLRAAALPTGVVRPGAAQT